MYLIGGRATILSTLDANYGCRQIEIDPRDHVKTAFTSHHHPIQFTRMLFGLLKSPATFQKAMDAILSIVVWKLALVYLDEIVVF